MLLEPKRKRFGGVEALFLIKVFSLIPAHRGQEHRLRSDFVSFQFLTFPSTKIRNEDMNREVDFISSSMSMINLSLAPVERLKNARKHLSNFEFRNPVPAFSNDE
jgi:hypothetical protein